MNVNVTHSGNPQTITVSGGDAPPVEIVIADPRQVEVMHYPNITITNDADLEEMVQELQALRPIILHQDVITGDLETVTIPVGNPNIIGMVQQIDEADGNRVYYPNFTTANNGRSAIFISVLTSLQNKIIIWPRPLEV